MPRFRVIVRRKEPEDSLTTITHSFYNVEAENKEEAIEKVRDKWAFPEDEVE